MVVVVATACFSRAAAFGLTVTTTGTGTALSIVRFGPCLSYDLVLVFIVVVASIVVYRCLDCRPYDLVFVVVVVVVDESHGDDGF